MNSPYVMLEGFLCDVRLTELNEWSSGELSSVSFDSQSVTIKFVLIHKELMLVN